MSTPTWEQALTVITDPEMRLEKETYLMFDDAPMWVEVAARLADEHGRLDERTERIRSNARKALEAGRHDDHTRLLRTTKVLADRKAQVAKAIALVEYCRMVAGHEHIDRSDLDKVAHRAGLIEGPIVPHVTTNITEDTLAATDEQRAAAVLDGMKEPKPEHAEYFVNLAKTGRIDDQAWTGLGDGLSAIGVVDSKKVTLDDGSTGQELVYYTLVTSIIDQHIKVLPEHKLVKEVLNERTGAIVNRPISGWKKRSQLTPDEWDDLVALDAQRFNEIEVTMLRKEPSEQAVWDTLMRLRTQRDMARHEERPPVDAASVSDDY